jgi:hypothetical protein
MTVTTPADIIRLVLKDTGVLGVGQTATAEDTNDVFDTMNMMLGEWASKRWLLFHLLDLSKVSTGAMSYTVGPGGDIDTGTMQRPDRLEDGCYFRQIITASSPNQIDYPLQLLESREDYSRIGLKQLTTIPQYVFYDPTYPLGTVYPWPVIQSNQYELHILVKAQLTQFDNLADEIDLPSQYFGALRYNLGCRVRPMYQLGPDPSLVALATDSLSVIRNMNAAVPRLRMPVGLGRGTRYNIFSDSNY